MWAFRSRAVWLIALLACTAPSVHARPLPVPFQSEYLAENWGLDEGFPENSCSGIVPAPDGAMWMGTFRGLVRFNGQKFSPWAPAAMPELKSTSIITMYRDRRGRVWFGTVEGLVMHDRGVWRRWQENDGWANRTDHPRSFAEAPDGTLVIGRSTGRIMQLEEGGKWRELPTPPGGGGTLCAFDETSTLYAVRPTHFAGALIDGTWQALPGDAGLGKRSVGTAQRRDGRAYVVLQNELLQVRAGAVVARTPLSAPVKIFWRAAEDAAGVLWLPAVDTGVYRIQPDGTVKHLLKADGLPHSGGMRVVYPDDHGSLWIGGGVGGLARLRPRRFHHIGEAEGMGDRVILTLAPLRDGRVLLTTYGAGLAYFDGTGAVEPLRVGRFGAVPFRSVLRRRDDSVWFGSFGSGLLRLDGDQITQVENGIFGRTETINTLFEDSRGRLWIGGDHQVAVLENGAFSRVGPLGVVERASSTLFAEQPDGTVLLARHNEVYAYGPAGLRAEPVLRLRDDQRIASILADRDSRWWIGTAGHGLIVRSGTERHQLSTDRGLPGEAITSLVQDNAGLLWFGSGRQVVRADPAELWRAARTPGALPALHVFDQGDGLRELDFPTASQPTVAKDDRGRLWFALVRGAAMIDPAQLKTQEQPPPVVVEALSYVAGTRSVSLDLLQDQAKASTVLPAGSHLIRISYAALDFLAPRKQRFRVRLGDERNPWQDMRGETTVNFLELPPGEHTLHVQASGSDGVWNRRGATFAFEIEPFYWQTRWFRGLVALALAGLVGGSVWTASLRRVRREREQLARDRHLATVQARLALVLENTSDFVQFADSAGRILYINRAGRALVGLGPDADLHTTHTLDLLAVPAREAFSHGALPAAWAQGTWSGESALRHRDGREIPVSLVLLAHRTVGGAQDFTSVIARDISAAKRHSLTQEALRELAARLGAATALTDVGRAVATACRTLFDYDAFFFTPIDTHGRPTAGAHAEDTPAGSSQPQIVATVMPALSPAVTRVLHGTPLLVNRDGTPADPTLHAFGARGFVERKSASLLFVPVRWREKTIGIVSVQSYRPQRYGSGDLAQLQTLAEHCGSAVARLAATAALRENEERLRLAMQTARLGSWEITLADRRLQASPEAETVYGCAPGALSGEVENLLRHVPADESVALRRQLEDLLTGRTATLQATHRLVLPDGAVRWLEMQARLLDTRGDPEHLRAIGVSADITGRRLAELARGKLEEQLRQSQKLEAVGTLAGGIAHDFNNILTAILGHAELARLDVPGDSALGDALDEIRRSGLRARDLVRRILAFSRPQENRRRFLAPLPLVEEAVKLLRPTIPANVEIGLTGSANLPLIEADSSEIIQVLVNLGTNAWHALGSRPGSVTFSVETCRLEPGQPPPHAELTPGDYVRITVRDDGPGIPPEVLPRIFDPFFTTKAPGEGTGLGLSIAHGILRSHGGAITAASTLGAGSTFALYFRATEGAPTPADAPAPAVAASAKPGRGQHVLCVDDEEAIVKITTRMLETAGFVTTGCVRPREALARFRAEPAAFALVVTDLSMPEMSGLELAAELQRIRPGTPVVLTTGYLRAGDEAAAQSAGIREIIHKPQNLDQLVPTITRLLAVPPAEA